jgi:hypothetical protein
MVKTTATAASPALRRAQNDSTLFSRADISLPSNVPKTDQIAIRSSGRRTLSTALHKKIVYAH